MGLAKAKDAMAELLRNLSSDLSQALNGVVDLTRAADQELGRRPFADVVDFHQKFLAKAKARSTAMDHSLDVEQQRFRIDFMLEELNEYKEAVGFGTEAFMSDTDELRWQTRIDADKAVDALVDLAYVALGTAYMHGFDFEESWRRVHIANMSKQLDESNPKNKGGIVKPAGWKAPSHHDLLRSYQKPILTSEEQEQYENDLCPICDCRGTTHSCQACGWRQGEANDTE